MSTELPLLQPGLLLRTLNDYGVDFVVIGGMAAVLHGSPRATYDLDVSFAVDPSNLDALGEALVALGANLRGAPPGLPFVPDGRTLRGVEIMTLTTPAGGIDLIARPEGAPRYEALRRNAERYEVEGAVVMVASVTDLISMKSAAGRPKDLADVAELEAILRLRPRSRKRRGGAREPGER